MKTNINEDDSDSDGGFYAKRKLSNFDLAKSHKKLKSVGLEKITSLSSREIEDGRGEENEGNDIEEERRRSLIRAKSKVLLSALESEDEYSESENENENDTNTNSNDSGEENTETMMIGLKEGESSFEIPELRPGGNYAKKHHPNREDGKTWKYEEYKNHPYYNPEYMADEDARRKILEKNPDHIFITAVAGHLSVHNVEKLYVMDDIASMMRRDAFLRQQQQSLLRDTEMNHSNARKELKSIEKDIQKQNTKISTQSVYITTIDSNFSVLRELHNEYMDAYLSFKEAHYCREAVKAVCKPQDVVSAMYYMLQAMKKFREMDYIALMDTIAVRKLGLKQDDLNEMESDKLDAIYQTIEDEIERYHMDKDLSYSPQECSSWADVIKHVKAKQYSVVIATPQDVASRLIPKLRLERARQLGRLCGLEISRDNGKLTAREEMEGSNVITLYCTGIQKILNTITEGTQSVGPRLKFLLELGAESPDTFLEHCTEMIDNFKQVAIKFIEDDGTTGSNSEGLNVALETIQGFIKSFVKKATSSTQYNNEMIKATELITKSKVDMERSIHSSDGDPLLALLFAIKIYLNNEKTSLEVDLERYNKQREDIKSKLRDIAAGKVRPTDDDIEYPYRQRRGWIEAPEHSGVVKIIPPVVAAISKAYRDLCTLVDGSTNSDGGTFSRSGYGGGARLKYSSVPVEQLQRLPEIYDLFAELVAVHVTRSSLRSNNQYYPRDARRQNELDRLNIIQKFKKMYYITTTLDEYGKRKFKVMRTASNSSSSGVPIDSNLSSINVQRGGMPSYYW
jgi:hypothetical protein